MQRMVGTVCDKNYQKQTKQHQFQKPPAINFTSKVRLFILFPSVPDKRKAAAEMISDGLQDKCGADLRLVGKTVVKLIHTQFNRSFRLTYVVQTDEGPSLLLEEVFWLFLSPKLHV